MGHTVKLMAPQFVKPYVKGNKNDANDAEAICEAVSRPNMRFVAIKTIEQQDIQAMHRIRTALIQQRTAKVNQIRGFLGEYGIVIERSVDKLRKALPMLLEDAENGLSFDFRALLQGLQQDLITLDDRVSDLDKKIQLLESKEKKYDGEGLCGLFHFGYNDWMIVDGIKYSAEYYSDDQNVYSDDEGQTYLVTTYIHVESKQEDDKSLYAIIKTTAKDVEDAEDLAETEDQVLCHFITAKQFNVLKQRIHEKADDDDEDFIKISNIDPETDVDIKEMY
jgi:hypothetical protein